MSLQAIRGMNDVLPAESHRWQKLEEILRRWLFSYGYRELRTPIVEQTELFVRSIGEVTDIVEKEMYSFTDSLNGDRLTLRPEGTASCVRAVNQHNLVYNGPQRLYYLGPMFRHERPQKGRYRQFHQLGVEAPGFAGPDVDAEHMIMAARLWRILGIGNVRLEINSLGTAECRGRYRERLIAYFESHGDALDAEAKRRLHSNPLRILDSKNPHMRDIIHQAPMLVDDLNDESRAQFAGVTELLDAAGVAWVHNPRLVRGLDYYNHTVYEWITEELGAQGTICAGGRYDGLIASLGGKPTPACGFAIGLERLLALLGEGGEEPGPDAYIVHLGEGCHVYAMTVAEALREKGLAVVLHGGGGSMKSQMKKADASGARFSLIVGEDERRAGEVTVKHLRREAEQVRASLDEAARLIGEGAAAP